jgi:hypothetical protein
MKFQSILALFPAIIASASAAPTERDVGPDPSQVTFDTVSYAGTGCPAGSVSNIASADRTVLTSIFDQFVAAVGPAIPVTSNRKNCQMSLRIHYPGGFQFSIFSADYRGFAQLDPGVEGLQKSTYYFSGEIPQVSNYRIAYMPSPILLQSFNTLAGQLADYIHRSAKPRLSSPRRITADELDLVAVWPRGPAKHQLAGAAG